MNIIHAPECSPYVCLTLACAPFQRRGGPQQALARRPTRPGSPRGMCGPCPALPWVVVLAYRALCAVIASHTAIWPWLEGVRRWGAGAGWMGCTEGGGGERLVREDERQRGLVGQVEFVVLALASTCISTHKKQHAVRGAGGGVVWEGGCRVCESRVGAHLPDDSGEGLDDRHRAHRHQHEKASFSRLLSSDPDAMSSTTFDGPVATFKG